MVYVYHFTPHCSTHIKNPETRINTGKNKFQKIYRLLLTFTPSAADTICRFFADTETVPADYDLVFTGDLGQVGTDLLYDLVAENGYDLRCRHTDCGLLMFDRERQDVHAGGSGCGCSAAVLASYVMHRFEDGTFHDILFCSTGALLSPTSVMQGESIPGITHLVHLKSGLRVD